MKRVIHKDEWIWVNAINPALPVCFNDSEDESRVAAVHFYIKMGPEHGTEWHRARSVHKYEVSRLTEHYSRPLNCGYDMAEDEGGYDQLLPFDLFLAK